MDELCYQCNQEGKMRTATFKIDSRPACAAHFMAHRKEHPDLPDEPVKDGPGPSPQGHLAKLADQAPEVNPTETKRCGRKPGSKNKPKPNTPTANRARQTLGLPLPTKPAETFAKHSTIAELLTKLRARRSALDEAITAVEMAARVLAQEEELR